MSNKRLLIEKKSVVRPSWGLDRNKDHDKAHGYKGLRAIGSKTTQEHWKCAFLRECLERIFWPWRGCDGKGDTL